MPVWAIPAAMAAVSALGEYKKSRDLKKHNQAQAELTKYSPWTGMRGQIQLNSPNYLGAAAKGGLQGMMLNNAMGAGAGGGALTGGQGMALGNAVGAAPATTAVQGSALQQAVQDPFKWNPNNYQLTQSPMAIG